MRTSKTVFNLSISVKSMPLYVCNRLSCVVWPIINSRAVSILIKPHERSRIENVSAGKCLPHRVGTISDHLAWTAVSIFVSSFFNIGYMFNALEVNKANDSNQIQINFLRILVH